MDGTLIYDEDCGFCVRSLRWGLRLGVSCAHRSWQSYADLAEIGLNEAAARDSAWYVTERETYRGHEAIARALMTSTRGWVRVLGRVTGSRAMRPVASRVYDWVATHRYQLPGGSDTCKLPD